MRCNLRPGTLHGSNGQHKTSASVRTLPQPSTHVTCFRTGTAYRYSMNSILCLMERCALADCSVTSRRSSGTLLWQRAVQTARRWRPRRDQFGGGRPRAGGELCLRIRQGSLRRLPVRTAQPAGQVWHSRCYGQPGVRAYAHDRWNGPAGLADHRAGGGGRRGRQGDSSAARHGVRVPRLAFHHNWSSAPSRSVFSNG